MTNTPPSNTVTRPASRLRIHGIPASAKLQQIISRLDFPPGSLNANRIGQIAFRKAAASHAAVMDDQRHLGAVGEGFAVGFRHAPSLECAQFCACLIVHDPTVICAAPNVEILVHAELPRWFEFVRLSG